MKKRILALLLTLALVLPAVSCDVLLSNPNSSGNPSDSQSQNNTPSDSEKAPVSSKPETRPQTPPDSEPEDSQPANQPDDTEYVEPEVSLPNDEPQTEVKEPDSEPNVTMTPPETMAEPETTAEPLPFVEPYEADIVASSFDTFYVNGEMYFDYDGGAGDKLDAQGNLIAFKTDEACQSMMLRGWIGFGREIQSFGYYIDTYDFIYGDFATATEDPVKAAGGEYASRFEILVPLANLGAGEHRVGFVVKLSDGTVVRLREEITVVIEKTYWQDSGILTHLSFDELDLWADDLELADVFIPGSSSSWNGVADCDLNADFLRYRGWIGATGNAIGCFGYRINGGKAVYDDSFTVEPEDMVVSVAIGITGATTASRMGVFIPVDSLEMGDNTVTVLYQDDLGNTVILSEFTVNLSETSTNEPDGPTDIPEDPMQPANLFYASDLDTLSNAMGIHHISVVRDSFLHIVPSNGDPNYYPFASVSGARYVAIRYRTTDAFNANIQIYIASRGVGPVNDSSMLQQAVIVDGEWHLAILDTQSLIDASIYDGKYVSYFRFDPLESGYMLDASGEPYYTEGTQIYARYDLPEGCSIDISYIGFFHSVDAAEQFDSQLPRDDTFFDGEIPEIPVSNGLLYVMNGDLSYSLNSIGSCTESDLVIPQSYMGLPVTRISPRAFWEATQLTSVVIPDSVKIIEQDSFPYCHNLKAVYIGRGVETIGPWAFFSCSSLTDIYYAGSKAEWEKISKGQQWYTSNATIHFNSEYQP